MRYNEFVELWKNYGIEEIPATPLSDTVPPKTTTGTATTYATLASIEKWLGNCQRCGLCKDRNRIVFGAGTTKAKLMFVGEGPRSEEDESGLPFAGQTGELLSKIIEAMGLTRSDVYLANVVKCRPPNDREPFPDEIENCLPFLKAQIEVVRPKAVIALGSVATRILGGQDSPMSTLRGKWSRLSWNEKIPLLPTYSPDYLLKNPSAKKLVWEDMKSVIPLLSRS